MTLSGRKVLITGASRGLGTSFVEAALVRRASTVYAAARDPARLPRFSDPARVVPVRLDVTDQQQVTAAAAERTDIDLLVSNAGVTCHGPVLGRDDGDGDDEATFREVLEVNFFGPLRLVRSFGPVLRSPGAGVIFVLTVGAVALSRSSPVYSASKAACLMLALAVREELRSDGATVTIVLPGFIDTEMAAKFDRPKAGPLQIAERSLDGWLAGRNTVWPDRFAELVRDVMGQPYEHLLDEPRKVMTDVQAAFMDAFMDQGSDG
jgi:NAD(P)-dependent dehydrogenase (short-subunit alcohol dehydrogenase family)